MPDTDTRTVAQDLALVNERLDVLRAAIAAAPTHRRLTEWFEGRVAEKQNLLLQRDRLREEARAGRP